MTIEQTIKQAHRTIREALEANAAAHWPGHAFDVMDNVETVWGWNINEAHVLRGQIAIGRRSIGRKVREVFNGEEVTNYFPAVVNGKAVICKSMSFNPSFGHAWYGRRWFVPVSEIDVTEFTL